MTRLSQHDVILAWLNLYPKEGLTPALAFKHLACLRLAARIAELRAEGFNIETRMETRGGKTYARYFLVRS